MDIHPSTNTISTLNEPAVYLPDIRGPCSYCRSSPCREMYSEREILWIFACVYLRRFPRAVYAFNLPGFLVWAYVNVNVLVEAIREFRQSENDHHLVVRAACGLGGQLHPARPAPVDSWLDLKRAIRNWRVMTPESRAVVRWTGLLFARYASEWNEVEVAQAFKRSNPLPKVVVSQQIAYSSHDTSDAESSSYPTTPINPSPDLCDADTPDSKICTEYEDTSIEDGITIGLAITLTADDMEADEEGDVVNGNNV